MKGPNYFSFNGRRSTDYKMYNQTAPVYSLPERQIEWITVPGRAGDLLVEQGGYSNVLVSYDCFFEGGPAQGSLISGWLYGAGGYADLRDSYLPGVFRRATFAGPLEFTYIGQGRQIGKGTIAFTCKPQLYTDEGQKPIELPIVDGSFDTTGLGVIYNPYPFASWPLIQIEGRASQIVTVQNAAGVKRLRCSTMDRAEVDCEMMNMHRGDTNLNSYLDVLTDFPTLEPGENIISMSRKAEIDDGSAPKAKLSIVPRWWHL